MKGGTLFRSFSETAVVLRRVEKMKDTRYKARSLGASRQIYIETARFHSNYYITKFVHLTHINFSDALAVSLDIGLMGLRENVRIIGLSIPYLAFVVLNDDSTLRQTEQDKNSYNSN